jgi:UDPglucose--hexose-1-phosphate uridylyltransferase
MKPPLSGSSPIGSGQKSRISQDTDNIAVDSSGLKPGSARASKAAPQHKGIKLNTHGIETEIRQDYLHENLVIIAPNRGNRPYDAKDSGHVLIETASSPRLDRNVDVCQLNDPSGDWLVKVVENKFPSLSPDNPQAYGKQEIVIDTPLAGTPFGKLDEDQIKNVLHTYQARTSDLMAQNGIEYVLIFKNDGFEAGASLAHAHSQIFALPMVPGRFKRESENVEAYFKENNRDPYEDIIGYEKRTKSRIVFEDDNMVVFCPYASQWPFEVWMLPKRAVTSLESLSQPEISTLARSLKKYLSKLTRHKISFNLYLENGASEHHRFCLKVCGRSNTWGGFEVASGIVINTVPPESAAIWYKGL